MGADVHAFIEKRTLGADWYLQPPELFTELPAGSWGEFVRRWRFSPRDCADLVEAPESEGHYLHRRFNLQLNRNYALFGVLAGVRWNDAPVIHPPRGVPDDASDKYRLIVAEWAEDAHTHSWATVAELLAYKWGRKRSYYTEKREPLRVICREFMGVLERLKAAGTPEDMRVVLFFDC